MNRHTATLVGGHPASNIPPIFRKGADEDYPSDAAAITASRVKRLSVQRFRFYRKALTLTVLLSLPGTGGHNDHGLMRALKAERI